MLFDVAEFCPSVSKELFLKVLTYVKKLVNIGD